MPTNVAFVPGLHCLQKYLLASIHNEMGESIYKLHSCEYISRYIHNKIMKSVGIGVNTKSS